MTRHEADIVRWLLEHGSAAAPMQPLIGSLGSLRVISGCGCGCPSVDFAAHDPAQAAKIVGEAYGLLPDGKEIGLILWGSNDRLQSLEVYEYGDHAHPFALPALDTLKAVGAA